MQTWEKLGVFYLGREIDGDTGESGVPLVYESKDLTTHAVALGMTGSGKTGLCLSLLEEAALDGIPGLLIDPKGDLGNLALTFPQLRPADFRPWIDEDAALRKGLTPDEMAAKTAKLWKDGLASWDQDGDRIRRLRDAADVTIYTPGGSSGVPLRVLKSLAAPDPATAADAEALRERVEGAVTSLLVLLDVEADPVTSREHILLSTLLDAAWREGRNVDLAGLVRGVQQPPFDRIGVMELDSFFPAKDRFALAMRLNAVLASPGFAPWREGEPLDIDALLRTADGRPRLSILSIAHLSERERMFFVTLLLHELVSWMRRQEGTGSLRALLYMDEIFGFFPPSAEPPSKKPMLTLLKQARAYGLGVVLSTQNPVDLDYKGLSNCGTWFLGRLQTERDRNRVLDGLQTVSAGGSRALDRKTMEKRLTGLKSRQFVMNNVHDDGPVLFGTRWAMSYLRGPLTSAQIKTLTAERAGDGASAGAASAPATPPAAASAETVPADAARPVLPPEIPEAFVPSDGSGGEGPLVYRPAIFAKGTLHYAQARLTLDEWKEESRIVLLDDEAGSDPWGASEASPLSPADLLTAPESESARYETLPTGAGRAKTYTTWSKSFASWLYRERPMILLKSADPKGTSKPGEAEAAFRARCCTRWARSATWRWRSSARATRRGWSDCRSASAATSSAWRRSRDRRGSSSSRRPSPSARRCWAPSSADGPRRARSAAHRRRCAAPAAWRARAAT